MKAPKNYKFWLKKCILPNLLLAQTFTKTIFLHILNYYYHFLFLYIIIISFANFFKKLRVLLAVFLFLILVYHKTMKLHEKSC